MTAPRPPGGGELPAKLREIFRRRCASGSTEDFCRANHQGIDKCEQADYVRQDLLRELEAAWPAIEREVLAGTMKVLPAYESPPWALPEEDDDPAAVARGGLPHPSGMWFDPAAPSPPTPAEVEAAVEEIAGCRCTDYEVAAGHNPRCTGQLADEILAALAHIRWADTLQAGRYRAALADLRLSADEVLAMLGAGSDPGNALTDSLLRSVQAAEAALFAPPPDGWAELAELVAAVRTSAAYAKAAAGNTTGDERVKHLAIADYGEAILRDLLAALPGLGEGRG